MFNAYFLVHRSAETLLNYNHTTSRSIKVSSKLRIIWKSYSGELNYQSTTDIYIYPTGTTDIYIYPTGTIDIYIYPRGTTDIYIYPTGTTDIYIYPPGTTDIYI